MRKLANGRQGFDVNAGGSEVVEGRDEEPAAKQVRYIDVLSTQVSDIMKRDTLGPSIVSLNTNDTSTSSFSSCRQLPRVSRVRFRRGWWR